MSALTRSSVSLTTKCPFDDIMAKIFPLTLSAPDPNPSLEPGGLTCRSSAKALTTRANPSSLEAFIDVLARARGFRFMAIPAWSGHSMATSQWTTKSGNAFWSIYQTDREKPISAMPNTRAALSVETSVACSSSHRTWSSASASRHPPILYPSHTAVPACAVQLCAHDRTPRTSAPMYIDRTHRLISRHEI